MNQQTKLTPADFASDQEVRWCPGCGDYAILKALYKTLAEIEARPENTVVISGIGCAARLPYYMNTYGFHTIHGRAPPIATGTKLTNPELDVWIITGDGDSMSIGGNHMLHVLRRDIDVQILLFNNEIYGLTKGQASPTSRTGTRSPTTPGGSVDQPVAPCVFALGAGARYVARSGDILQKHLPDMMARAHAHKGASFVEILQNCHIYNDHVFEAETSKKTTADHTVLLEHGAPMIFGAARDKGLRLNTTKLTLEVVTIGADGVTEADLMIHDETNITLANMLARLQGPEFPVAMGVLYNAGEGPAHAALPQWDEAERTSHKAMIADIEKVLTQGASFVKREG